MQTPRPKRVVIESPYAGDTRRNLVYAKLAMLDSIYKGEAPFASHILYTALLDDDDKDERALGLRMGAAWAEAADLVAFYIDFGMSVGMMGTLSMLKNGLIRVPYEERKLSSDVLNSLK